MKLQKFIAKNVHGYLNYDIEFDERLTFLIGINGTGKTSVLKLILGLISPSFNNLDAIEFEIAELVCVDFEDNKEVKITARKKTDNEIELSLKLGSNKPYLGSFNKSFLSPQQDLAIEESQENHKLLIEIFDSLIVVKEIKRLTTPFFLGLDRRVYGGQQIDRMRQSYLYNRRYKLFPKNDPLNISLIEIQEVIYDYVRRIASKQLLINEEFKHKVLMQSFEFVERSEMKTLVSPKELKKKREDALKAFDNLNIQGLSDLVNTFFDNLDEAAKQLQEVQKENKNKKSGDKKIEIQIDYIDIVQRWFNNQPQLKRINELIRFNQEYQAEIEKLYEPIEKAKNIVNKFFQESKKELLIDSQGELKVKFLNGKDAKIFELSSGEKQIVTMLGHLIFFEERFKTDTGIFIIDEPELSLHIAWQEIFVKSILDASPNTQFILATHSPSIVMDYQEELCQDLAKLN